MLTRGCETLVGGAERQRNNNKMEQAELCRTSPRQVPPLRRFEMLCTTWPLKCHIHEALTLFCSALPGRWTQYQRPGAKSEAVMNRRYAFPLTLPGGLPQPFPPSLTPSLPLCDSLSLSEQPAAPSGRKMSP